MNFKYAVFDMDGTLINSMDLWDKCERKIIGDFCGVNLLTGEHSQFVYRNIGEMLKHASSVSGKECTLPDVLESVHVYMHENYQNGTIKPLDGAVDFLKHLKDNGVKIAIATATDFDNCKKCLEENGILGLIDAFVSTREAGKDKRYPDVYLKAMEKIGADKENTLIFEDAAYCINTLVNNGFRFAIIHDGLRSSVIPEEHKNKAEYYIYSYKELDIK